MKYLNKESGEIVTSITTDLGFDLLSKTEKEKYIKHEVKVPQVIIEKNEESNSIQSSNEKKPRGRRKGSNTNF